MITIMSYKLEHPHESDDVIEKDKGSKLTAANYVAQGGLKLIS